MPLDPLDVDELVASLGDREHLSLPFEVTPADPARSVTDLLPALNDAIRAANLSADAREPHDPTSSDLVTVVAGSLVAEINEGSMEDAEIRAWLGDLGRRLDQDGVHVRVAPHVAGDQIPNIDAWMSLPPTPTAFLHFTDPNPDRLARRIPMPVIERMAEPLIAWSRVTGGTVVVRKGLFEVATSEARAAEVLLEGMPLDPPQFGVRCFELGGRQQRSASFGFEARGDMQVLDETPLATRLDRLLEGIRVVAHALDYASVRRATPVVPSDFDPPVVLGRPMTRMEELAAGGRLHHLLPDYVPDVSVAQVLTDSHLTRARDLSRFAIEPLGHGRHLVRALDVEPWLDGLNPRDDVLAEARRAFGDMLVTDELYAAQRR